jgi:hypothetical protein
MVIFLFKELLMNFGDEVWVVYDLRNQWIVDSGENSLPLIFDNENEALDHADSSPLWEVRKASIGMIS